MRHIFHSLIIVTWLATMAVLVTRYYPFPFMPQPSHEISGLPAGFLGERWMGIYYDGEKIGYAKRNIKDSGDGYEFSEAVFMKINVMGTAKVVETLVSARLDREFTLLGFEAALSSEFPFRVSGDVHGRELEITIESAGSKTSRTMRLREKPTLNFTVLPGLLKGGLSPGKQTSAMVIDPATLTEEKVSMRVEGTEMVVSGGRQEQAYLLKGSVRGAGWSLWLKDDGEVLKEENDLGFTLVKETAETAVKIGRPAADLITKSAVLFKGSIPPDASYLRIRLSGILLPEFDLDGGRQKLKDDILEIRREFLDGLRKTQAPEGFVGESLYIQSKHPGIKALAAEIRGDEKDDLRASRRIYDWVFANIIKEPAITIPMAADVLKAMKGDCNEHSVLFVALARAAGVPSRIALGLTFGEGAFFYHAWPEIFIDRWIAVDPTLGQFPADASHIRLVSGDISDHLRLLPALGKIRIEVLEAR